MTDSHGSQPHSAPRHAKGNDGQKWLAGAALAALVLGGGYYALKNLPASQSTSAEVASTEAMVDSPSTYSAPSSTSPSFQGSPSTSETASSAAVDDTSATTTARRRATAKAAPAPVPEQVVGITPASITTDNSDEIVVTPGRRPVWASVPSQRRLSGLYPTRALERGREGEASVSCTVLDAGALDCVRVSEYPANSGFGNAALRVAKGFRHSARRADGSAAYGTPVNLRVVFRIDDGDRRRG